MKRILLIFILTSCNSIIFATPSISLIVLTIVNSPNGYKPYAPFISRGVKRDSITYSIARIGSDVTVSFDKQITSDWTLSISEPKVGVSDVTGTPSNRYVGGTSFVSYYEVMDGKLRGSCVQYHRDKSLLNLYSKFRAETQWQSVCR
jgi:hypothetical protein